MLLIHPELGYCEKIPSCLFSLLGYSAKNVSAVGQNARSSDSLRTFYFSSQNMKLETFPVLSGLQVDRILWPEAKLVFGRVLSLFVHCSIFHHINILLMQQKGWETIKEFKKCVQSHLLSKLTTSNIFSCMQYTELFLTNFSVNILKSTFSSKWIKWNWRQRVAFCILF